MINRSLYVLIIFCFTSCGSTFNNVSRYKSYGSWTGSFTSSSNIEALPSKPGEAYLSNDHFPSNKLVNVDFIGKFGKKNGINIFISNESFDGVTYGLNNQYKLYHLGRPSQQFNLIRLKDTAEIEFLAPLKRKDISNNNLKGLPSLFESVLNEEVIENIDLILFEIDSASNFVINKFDTTIKREEFPDSLNYPTNKFLFIFHNSYTTNCSKLLGSYVSEFSALNPECANYDPYQLWHIYISNYVCFINIMENNKISDINKRKSKIIRDYEKFMRSIMKDNLQYLTSYFEIIFWQLYKPIKFMPNDASGLEQSLLFTSNNPDYPGNYEVKFNIYEPYRFKVFKR